MTGDSSGMLPPPTACATTCIHHVLMPLWTCKC